MRDTFGNLLVDHANYMHAFHLCEEMLVAFGAAIAAMWGGVMWMRRQDVKRQEHAIGLLVALIDKVEARTRAENG